LSQELERVYTINLGKVLLSQSQHRAVRAINMIREFARRHMKVDDVKIDQDLSHQIWKRGIRRPPRKIRVKMTKTDDGFVLVSLYEEEIETKVKPEEKEVKLEKDTAKEARPKEEIKKVLEVEEEKITEKPKKEPKVTTEKPKKEPKVTTEKPKKEPKVTTEKPKKEPKVTTEKPKKKSS